MLSKIKLILGGEDISSFAGSSFHGFLMEEINRSFKEKLHLNGLKPYSQALYKEKDKYIWQVSCQNREIFSAISEALLCLDKINIKNKDREYDILKKEVETIKIDDFIKKYISLENPNTYINIKLLTPTSFKSQGTYINMPDIRLIFQSLIKKFDAINQDYKFMSQELIEDICSYVKITRYNLFSRDYPLEGIKIPAFQGNLTFKVIGSNDLKNLLHLLLAFGEYSGVGIKTSLGMGKIKKIGSEQWNKKK